MAFPQNEVDICNLALDYLNVAPITTLTNPTTKEGRVCERWYDATRKSVLRKHTWNFASKRVEIAKDATAPAFGYSTRYQLPTDYIRLVRLGDANNYKDYAVEDGYILMNVEETSGGMDVKYIYDNKNVEDYDPLFAELLALELAYNIAFPLTGNITMQRSIKVLRDEKLLEARGVDGQERPPVRYERSRFKEARMKKGYYGSPYIED